MSDQNATPVDERAGKVYAPIERLDGLNDPNRAEMWMHRSRYLLAARRLKNLASGEQLRVIDIACGLGYGSKIVAERRGAHVEGVDVSEEALTYAREHYTTTNVNFNQGSITNIEFEDASFDAAICFETIEHLSLSDAQKAMEELHRVLRPGGTLLISTPNRYFTWVLGLGGMKNEYHLYEFRPQELGSHLKKTGFEVRATWGQTLVNPISYVLGRMGHLPPRVFFPSRALPMEAAMIGILEARKQ